MTGVELVPDPQPTIAQAQVDVLPFGLLDPMIPLVVAANIHAVLGLDVRVRQPRPRPDTAFIPSRRQFDATKIIASLASETDAAPFRLGIIRHDLCVPILTYVYGESQIGGKAAVISSFRLFDPKPDVIYERVAKIGIHEFGHMLGLNHCWELDCLMRFSKQVEQLDMLSIKFCPTCQYEISRSLHGTQA